MLKIRGRLDGREISFKELDNGGSFASIIPKDIDAEYIIEIEVEDEAGNVTYRSNIIYFYDRRTFSWVTLPIKYLCSINNKKYYVSELYSRYYQTNISKEHSYQLLNSRYRTEVQICIDLN